MASGSPAPAVPLLVQSYGPGFFTIAGQRHTGSVLIAGSGVLPWPQPPGQAIEPSWLEPLRGVDPPPEVLILGLGPTFRPVPPETRAEIRAWGIVVEPMSTSAACRTFNVLVGENRRVAAALLVLSG